MKIKSIYIDGLHNTVNKTYAFSDIVYLIGRNGAGKSTVLQAIQLALLGYIPGTAKNSREAILRHSPKGEITVELRLEDATITRKIWKLGNRIDIDPVTYDLTSLVKDLELPIFNFNEFVGQTANKLKEYFIKNILPTTDGELNWEKILTESILDCNFQDREEIINYGLGLVSDLDGEILDQVIAANNKFKEEQSFNKSEVQRLQNTIDSLIYYDDYVGVTDPVALNAEILSLNALRDQLLKYETAHTSVQSQQTEIANLESRLDHLGGKEEYDHAVIEVERLNQQSTKYAETILGLRNKRAELQAKDDSYKTIICSNGICPYTKDSCKSISSKIDAIRNDSASLKAECVELNQEITRLENEHSNISTKIRQLEGIITDFNSIWGHIETLKKITSEVPEKPDTDKTVTQIDAELEMLNNNMMKLQANIKYNETIENLTTMKFESELRGEALSKWVKATDTNGLQTTLMVKPFEELADTMTGYLHQMYRNTDIKAHFVITSKANSFSFGLIRDGVYIPYDLLSSGEKCLYMLALMICIVNNNKSPLKVLLCDDMFDHLDSTAIENTFATLKNISGIQFIFAGVKDCENAKDVVLRI